MYISDKDKEKMRGDLMFLRGMLEGMSYFSSDRSMSDSLETVQNLFDALAENVGAMME